MKMSKTATREYIVRMKSRYQAMKNKQAQGRMLDEFCATTELERKHAIKVLRHNGVPREERCLLLSLSSLGLFLLSFWGCLPFLHIPKPDTKFVLHPRGMQGRQMTEGDLDLVRGLLALPQDWNRTRLGQDLCARWNGWGEGVRA